MSGTGEAQTRKETGHSLSANLPEAPQRPPIPDALESVGGDVTNREAVAFPSILSASPSAPGLAGALPQGMADAGRVAEEATPEWVQMQARHLLREFLSVVPRSDETATVTFPCEDGTMRTLTRREVSAAIDRMRPRMRQILRLGVEERRTQEEVSALLGGVSVRTIQRDLAEALDLLAQL